MVARLICWWPFVMLSLAASLGGHAWAQAQATIDLGTHFVAPGAVFTPITIRLVNPQDVVGVQVAVLYDPTVVSIPDPCNGPPADLQHCGHEGADSVVPGALVSVAYAPDNAPASHMQRIVISMSAAGQGATQSGMLVTLWATPAPSAAVGSRCTFTADPNADLVIATSQSAEGGTAEVLNGALIIGSLSQGTITAQNATGPPGGVATVIVSADSELINIAHLTLTIQFPPALLLSDSDVDLSSSLTSAITIKGQAPGQVTLASEGNTVVNGPGVLARLNFHVPPNAAPEDAFPINLSAMGSDPSSTSAYPINVENGAITVPILNAHLALYGDLNQDGNVNLQDVSLALQVATGATAPTVDQALLGDIAPLSGDGVFGDGQLNTADALRLLRYVLGVDSNDNWPGSQSYYSVNTPTDPKPLPYDTIKASTDRPGPPDDAIGNSDKGIIHDSISLRVNVLWYETHHWNDLFLTFRREMTDKEKGALNQVAVLGSGPGKSPSVFQEPTLDGEKVTVLYDKAEEVFWQTTDYFGQAKIELWDGSSLIPPKPDHFRVTFHSDQLPPPNRPGDPPPVNGVIFEGDVSQGQINIPHLTVYDPVPLTTERLYEIAEKQGIGANLQGLPLYRKIGRAFQEHFVTGYALVKENHKVFPSPLRAMITNGKRVGVMPDSVLPVSDTFIHVPSIPPITNIRDVIHTDLYKDSVFIEAKAVHGKITLESNDYQIAGMLEVLARSEARMAGKNPVLVFITTDDTDIGDDVFKHAEDLKIDVWQYIAWEQRYGDDTRPPDIFLKQDPKTGVGYGDPPIFKARPRPLGTPLTDSDPADPDPAELVLAQ